MTSVKELGDAIVRMHDGQMFFNFTEVAAIIGCGVNTVSALLHSHGITVKKVGPSKRVSAYDLAEVMIKDRISPIDNG
ncbi:MAG: helix-turn-helix domain-containing protein [Peptococcaceae bacterium]|nr:helix-turn-helix domain-containing protein [Peptococcaceae bacterium]